MKKVLLFLFVFGAFGISDAVAQCSGAKMAAGKSCCASKAAKAATTDANIEKRSNEDGSVAYVRKEADAQGNVRFVAVTYDETANAFVNVAPVAATGKACCASKAEAGKSCGAAKSKASCEKKEAKVEN
jgi:hypothetical protein